MAEPVTAAAGVTWRDYLSLTIATIALIWPGCLWLWRRVFRRGRIDIFKSGIVEVGYSNYGPTIGLQGTLSGRDKEQFVRAISVQVIREADNSQHGFDWFVFRSVRFVSTRPNEIGFVLPAGFLLLPSQPFRYNILFHDAVFQLQQVQSVLDPLRAAWLAAVQQALGPGALPLNPQQAPAQIQHASQAAYPAFSQQPIHVQTFMALNQQFYWNPGWYTLRMEIETAHPTRTVTKRWRFELTQAQSQTLRGNALKIVQEACDQYIWQYQFANVPYHEVP
jgi:hypothetical protein